MPREDRHIIFENAEVYSALTALVRQRENKRLPEGAIEIIKPNEADKKQIVLFIQNPADGMKAKREYSADFIIAALMMYCRSVGIPLPKGARKSLIIEDNIATLRVQIK